MSALQHAGDGMIEDQSNDGPTVTGRHGFITSADVAERAGVSRSAVSRTFTPGASVSPEVKRRVIAAADELGYRVNRLARGLISARSHLVGLVSANLDSPFSAMMLSKTMAALSQRGLNALVFEYDDDSIDMRAEVQRILEFRVEAIVVLSGLPSATIVEECVANGVRLVVVNRAISGPGALHVQTDDESGGRMAADRLIRAGAKRLAVVASESGTPAQTNRVKSFVERAGAHGLSVEVSYNGPTRYECGQFGAHALHNRSPGAFPDGVFCTTDLIAVGLMDAVRNDLGLRIPDDVSVIGFNDIPQAAWGAYQLTTFRQNVEEVAQAVARSVRSDGHAQERLTIVPASLIERASVRA